MEYNGVFIGRSALRLHKGSCSHSKLQEHLLREVMRVLLKQLRLESVRTLIDEESSKGAARCGILVRVS
jgi:hypothetical protein